MTPSPLEGETESVLSFGKSLLGGQSEPTDGLRAVFETPRPPWYIFAEEKLGPASVALFGGLSKPTDSLSIVFRDAAAF